MRTWMARSRWARTKRLPLGESSANRGHHLHCSLGPATLDSIYIIANSSCILMAFGQRWSRGSLVWGSMVSKRRKRDRQIFRLEGRVRFRFNDKMWPIRETKYVFSSTAASQERLDLMVIGAHRP